MKISPEVLTIENWIYRIIVALEAYEFATGKDMSRFIVKISFLSDYELYNPLIMCLLFKQIEEEL